ncbi:hypothetical protein HBI56_012480 [Parastagonospora nodorum]|nr:hypothetical protein HBI10_092870 [Parastagonospora nodorum]KAH4033622.1 hypothetical protein HBI13_012880 [Parastagonospora nodorum]KAH4235280.1 hypothetical protein HBI06_061030 [Parastagonospora nodorum]KAH4250053.1 hypothetical protein HBI05_013230 [Parastagonospora nodorum]KAH4274241.1 hypothetical protein HBI03_007290 [Parastagonospora nodorum]
MRFSLNSIALATLLSSIPLASVVQSYPTGGYVDIVDTSKRGFGFPKPSVPPIRDPLRNPNTSPSVPGNTGSAASTWRNFADGDLRYANAEEEAVRAKGQGLIQDLENAKAHQSPSIKIKSLAENGYSGQGTLNEPPDLGIHGSKRPYREFDLDLSIQWRGDEIKRPGSEVILKAYESPKQKAMIISDSRNQQHDTATPEMKLTWSAMVASNWQEAATAAGVAVSDLKYIIRNNVQPIRTESSGGLTLETIPAMKQAFVAMNKPTTETLTLDFMTTNKIELQQISKLSAQTHVARVLQMLKDYREDFKDLAITKLHLQDYTHSQSDYQYNIIIELGR